MQNPLHFDVCIIGSGPAGALVAHQLAGSGRRVAIIEAGGWKDRDELNRRMRNGGAEPYFLGANAPHLHVPVRITGNAPWSFRQTRMVGGNSLNWGGLSPRPLEHQFEMRTRYGVAVDWPLLYADIESHLCDAEDELGVSGDSRPSQKPWRSRPYPMPPHPVDIVSKQFINACEVLGLPTEAIPVARNSGAYRGRDGCSFYSSNGCITCPSNARYSSDVTHVRDAIRDPNLTLLTDTIVTRLVLGEAGRIKELQCLRPDRSSLTITAGTYIVACNGILTARLLLQSGIANRSGMVGRHLMGHPAWGFMGRIKTRVLAARVPMATFTRAFENGDQLQHTAGVRIAFSSADKPAPAHGQELVAQGFYGKRLKDELRYRAGHGIMTWAISDCLPNPDNRVELDHENLDPFGEPGLKIHYGYSEYEMNARTLARGHIRRMYEVLGGELVAESGQDFAHQIGTARMGTDPTTSVVNTDLRSHDVENLYLAGASVFPTALGSTNPTLTLAALSLRLGQHLRKVLA